MVRETFDRFAVAEGGLAGELEELATQCADPRRPRQRARAASRRTLVEMSLVAA